MPEESEDSNTGSIRSDRTGQAESENDVTLAENPRQRQLTRTGKQRRVTTKRNSALVLSDTSNSAPAVQLEGAGTVVPSVPEKSLVPGAEDAVLKKLEALINSGKYEEVTKLADGIGREEFLKHLCQAVTNLDQFKGLFRYLKQRGMVPGFLAHGDMVLVRKGIVETIFLKLVISADVTVSTTQSPCHSTKIVMMRVAGLFEAAHERPDWKSEFDVFVMVS